MPKALGTACPSCGEDNPLGRMFCNKCGTKLDMNAGQITSMRPRREINLGVWVSRIFRLLVLGALLTLLGLLVWPIAPEGAEGTETDARSFYNKVTRLEQAQRRGEPEEGIFSEAEVNSYLRSAQPREQEGGSFLSLAPRDLRVRLPKDQVVFYAQASAGPVTLSYRIAGIPHFDGRKFRFEPVTAHLGHVRMPGKAATGWLARRVGAVLAGMEREIKVLDNINHWQTRDGAVKLISDSRPRQPLPPVTPRHFR